MDWARQSNDGATGGDIVSEVGNEIRVTLDQWSVGDLGVSDLIAAGAVVAGALAIAWLVNRLVRRAGRHTHGSARTAIGTIGQLVGAAVMLVSAALVLEILGFNLGPILVVMLIVVIAALLLRPLIVNLSSGLLLQLRGGLDLGDLVTTGAVLGTVREITTRTVVLDTSDGRRVHVPNSDVLNDTIVNYSSLGHRRSSFEVMISCDDDLERVLATIELALTGLGEVEDAPAPEVQVARLIGRLVVIKAYVWHSPALAAERARVHLAIRAVLDALRDAGVDLAGPTIVQLRADGSLETL